MALLLEIFGFLSVLLDGLKNSFLVLGLGGLLFLTLMASAIPAAAASTIIRHSVRLIRLFSLGLAVAASAEWGLQAAILADLFTQSIGRLARDISSLPVYLLLASAVLIWVGSGVAIRQEETKNPTVLWLSALALLVGLSAAAMASHGAARLENSALLMAVYTAHLFGAVLWVGGLPYFLVSLHATGSGAKAAMARRFSIIAATGVGLLCASGITMARFYTDGLSAFYGTSYGLMLGTKISLFLCMGLLGAMNFRHARRLAKDAALPARRLIRFSEAELGIGITILLAAASITSQPPAADLQQDRASLSEIVERMTPAWPRLTAPAFEDTALAQLRAQLAAEAAARGDSAVPPAYVPGSGVPPPRNAEDIATSEFNHNVAGVILLVAAILAILAKIGGYRWAANWPLCFIALAIFLFTHSDRQGWPFGDLSLLESMRDSEWVQHRIFVVLIVGFALFEWRVQYGRLGNTRAALAFPLTAAIGGAVLLTHSHALTNLKEEVLIEWTHMPLAVLGIVLGWSRWIELRTASGEVKWASWVWPIALLLVALLLTGYKEA